MQNYPTIVSIEGNIGSGKSTLVETLKDIFKSRSDICFLDEPVETWNSIQDKNGKNIIEKYYENQEKYAFSFQMMAYISRISLLRKALKNSKNKLIITERSIFTDRNVFAKMLYDDDKIQEVEFVIYNKWFDEFINDIPDINVIYLQVKPEIAMERVIKRNRPGENINLEYLSRCNLYHDLWLGSEFEFKRLTLNGNENIDDNKNLFNEWIPKILNFFEELLNEKLLKKTSNYC